MNLNEIEALTKKLSEVRAELGGIITRLKAQQEAFLARAMPDIKRCVRGAAAQTAGILVAVDENRALFDRPRTQIFHGIKVGLHKGTGGISWEDADAVVERIEKRFSKREADLLIKTTKKPIAKALADLDVADLKAIGCTVEDTGDVVVVRPVDRDVDKAVNALLKSALTEAQEVAA